VIIKESFTLSTDVEHAASVLLDVDTVAHCVPGVGDVTETEQDRYEASLGMQLGPVKPQFKGWLHVDRTSAPGRIGATAEGRDRGTGSVAQVTFTADLSDNSGRTAVDVTADVRIRGRLGQFGTGVIQSAAKEVLRQFVDCVEAGLAADGAGVGSTTGAGQVDGTWVRRARPGTTGGTLRILWAAIRGFLRDLFGRGKGMDT